MKFKSNDPRQKEFGIAVREKVNSYFREQGISTKGGISLLIKAIIMLMIYISPFVLILSVPLPGWIALLLTIVMGIGEAGIGMGVMHDGAHESFSSKQWVNRLFSSTMFLLGSNTFNWKVQHNILHHTFTNIYGFDQDIESKATLRLCEHAPLKKFHRFQYLYAYFFYGLMTISKLVTDIDQLISFNREGITREQKRNPKTELVKLITIKIFYFSILIGLPLLLTDFSIWHVLLGFGLMHLTAGMIMSTVFQMAHVVEGTEQPLPDKDGIIKNEWAVHELLTTSDFGRDNHFLSWYTGGLNFQIEHHLFPNTSHIHYRKIAPIVEQTAHEFGFTYNLKPDFMSAFISHSKRLKALGRLAHPKN